MALPTESCPRGAFSLLEILATVTIVGIVSVIIISRVSQNSRDAKVNACHAHRGNIEVQAQGWYRNKGAWPATNLSDIGADSAYLPDGVPVCPVDGSAYTFDSSTQQITGHDH